MKTKILLFLALSLSALSGCASAAWHQAAEAASRSGTPADLVRRMERGDRLALADIETLARNQVPDDTVLVYLRKTPSVYKLTTAQIDQLRASSVSDRIIDYLLSTPSQVARRTRGTIRYYPWRGYGYPHHGFGHFSGGGHSFGHHSGGHHGGHR